MTKISLVTDMSVLLWEVYLLISASIFPGSADRQSGRATYMDFRQKRQLPQYIPLLLSKAMWEKWVVRGSTLFPEEFGCIWRLWFLHLEYKAGSEGKERERERCPLLPGFCRNLILVALIQIRCFLFELLYLFYSNFQHFIEHWRPSKQIFNVQAEFTITIQAI